MFEAKNVCNQGLERSSIGVSDLRLFWELPSDFAIFIRDVKEGSFTRISRLLIFFSLETFEPQISDFGLAKWLPDQWTHHTVCKVESTFGYLPHKFFMHGIVDEKTDVYAYGVLLLELITGRQALDSSQKSLIMWAMINDIFAHRKPARIFGSVFYCMLLAGYATLAIGTEWIFRPKQEVISPVLCSYDVLLLLLTCFFLALLLFHYRNEIFLLGKKCSKISKFFYIRINF
ncbi:PTI1-like tyrosine-protein kinase 3 isoform X1 [Arachis ipaensis]|uniref:PTI1-like tyrosine-protein kinase 3 isoform X1 n=1 Tax=Arachis ipaensis TaxID=130454 RepID=UPI000A2B5DCE|nr:PTI1-like tyrosine-protein kinase 3 isoform X1 [Arachis ipaensis]XP_020978915.1 PTI1-like tyrosine-protein kinase 3 isoform X1 [Arachis ipaensis]XP_025653994.1 PTI1-like tyrosine-protein kinase 3 isoform X1 [Arachis hypogaea]XP_025653995.1 PTI1-like tyrosine-protein kinase 3 isoform X1 [Arachis hypogaea]